MRRDNQGGEGAAAGPRNLVLIGFMGTGKSAIGRALSRRLAGRHVDTDHEVEMACSKKIPQIFAEDGEDAFRDAEERVVRSLVRAATQSRFGQNNRPLIVSTGGGTPLRAENAALLPRIGKVLWLTASTETIVKRVTRSLADRPLLAGSREDPATRIASLIDERAPRYAALAAHTVNTSQFTSPDEAAKHLISLLRLNEDT